MFYVWFYILTFYFRFQNSSGNNLKQGTSPKSFPNSPNGKISSSRDNGKASNRVKFTKPVRKESDRIKLLMERANEAKKRKFIESNEELTEIKPTTKRRRVGSVERNNDEVNDSYTKAPVLSLNGLVSHESRKPLTVSLTGKQKINNVPQSPDKYISVTVNGVEKLCKYNDRLTGSSFNGSKFDHTADHKDEVDGEIVDKNLNNISNCIKNENLQQLYERKLLSADVASSPFKGKMSAFEISLLKGKQNLERRKSLESATLRSSPRTNRHNKKRPNYSDTKKRCKARLSLNITERSRVSDRNPRQQGARRSLKRKRTKSDADTADQKQVNELKEDTDSARGSCRLNKMNEKSSSRQIRHRLNGSRRNSLPDKLALSSLSKPSGSSRHLQGQSSSTLSLAKAKTSSQRFCPKQISGKCLSSSVFKLPASLI